MLWPFSEKARKQWDEWNIRVVVLISLFLQILLIAFANSRRKRSNKALTAAIWSFYLLADWIAAFAVGLISSGQTNDCPETTAVNRQLAAFWAPFLLLHLGGPDAITAFSLEDNELWIRHLLGLLVQVAVVLYAFLQSLQNDYWIPTVLMFFAGACKYAERTISLYRACLGNFKKSLLSKPDPGPNYAQLMAEYSALKASGVPVEIKVENEPNNGSDGDVTNEEENKPENGSDKSLTILKGYQLFKTFKGLIVDSMFSFHERDDSRKFFIGKKAEEAFQVMEVELNFMYDVLYTKMAVVHSKIGLFCRLLCTVLIAACFWQFAWHPHHNVRHFDKIISYILLVGAVVLELVSLFNIVFSDWFIVSAWPVQRWVSSTELYRLFMRLFMRLPFFKRDKRWSNIMFQHSFISFSLMEHHWGWLNKIAVCIGLEDILIEIQYKGEEKCLDSLKAFVFTELVEKAKKATTTETTKEMYSARGAHILDDYYSTQFFDPCIWASLSDEVEYDESLLLWHIATELCYFAGTDRDNECKACKCLRTDRCYNVSEACKSCLRTDRCYNEREACQCPRTDSYNDRKVCKLLSDYMLYLLIMRPTLMSSVAGIAQVRFQDTCAEAKKFFKGSQWKDDDQRKEACRRLLEVNTEAKPKEVKGDRSKSLLFDACILANHLNNVRDKWKIMSKVWVELMSYAASRCRGADHARQLAQGGEFITFVWLLMVHFGLGEQFRIQAGHARAKLLVGK